MSSQLPKKFATRQNLGLNRPPAIWFIRRFLNPSAEILLFPTETISEEAKRIGAVVFHTPGYPLHVDKDRKRTTLDAIMTEYQWVGKDPAMDMFAEIINDATYNLDTKNLRHPQAYGIRALNQGFKVTKPGDEERMAQLSVVFDALYAWCGARIAELQSAG